MDESYLEWLSSIPGSDLERARHIAERFPTYDQLRAASRAELASIEGFTPTTVDRLLQLLGHPSADESSELFLCPKCGSFIGTRSTSCAFCGVEFEGASEASLSEDLDSFLNEEETPSRICLTCGASMGRDATACPICGRQYGPAELAVLPGLLAPLDESAPFCARCGGYLFADEAECAICGKSVAVDAAKETSGSRGVGKDFLTRWQRMAPPEVPSSAEDRLREELDHYDRLLEANATLERAWANRAKILEKLGRHREAADSLAKAADLSPAREGQYRIEVQNVLRATSDAPALPPRWHQPAATAPPKVVDTRLLDALAQYESLLQKNPSLVVAWRTKAEILDRLERREEARASEEQAERLERVDDRTLRAAVEGLRSSGLATPGLSGTGHTNGRTNGTRNGRTNGRVNGLAEGRTNGLTTGAVNGLTFGRGATNGLVNGNGFTNGRRGRQGTPRIPAQPHWSRSVTGIAAVVALMVIVPILASMLSPSPGAPSSIIRIDGDFSDWALTPAYADSPIDQVQNPAVNLMAVKVATQDRDLFVNVQVQGFLFTGGDLNETDSVFVFVDEDANADTGYPIGDIGADSAVEVFGWSELGVVEHGVSPLKFNASGSPRSNDWNRFLGGGSAEAAFSGPNLELRMTANDPTRARVLAYAADNLGNRDAADGSIVPSTPTLVVGQTTVAADVTTGPTTFLRVTLAPLGGAPHVSALNLTRLGNSTDAVDLTLYRDDGSGSFDAADSFLSTVRVGGAMASLPTTLDLTSPVVLWVEAGWTNVTPTSTFGLTVSGLSSNGTPSFQPPEVGLVYLGAAPTSLRIDGAFGDWQGRAYGQDVLGDVTNRTGAPEYNTNVDLLATAVDLGTNFTGYVRVDGRLLGGQDIPTSRTRSVTSAVDTDLDSVPDWVESALGPTLARDFDNDNVTDDQTGFDVDGDALIDYPDGADCWLNTTIPAWFQAPYAGRMITHYACPIGVLPRVGTDLVYAFIDADNRSATGLFAYMEGQTYGVDFVIAIAGRNGAVNSSGLYAFASGRADPWLFIRDIAVAHDARRMEFAADAIGLNIAADFRVAFEASDWRRGSDIAFPDTAIGLSLVAVRKAGGTMAPLGSEGGPTVMDLAAGETFWLLDTDHGSETACTTNKVAATTPGTGPATSLTLNAGQSACWYLDEATGESIPAGTWETALDMILAHGVAAYGEESVDTPRYRTWAGSFGVEGSARPAQVVPEWIVLAASPLGPEMILGVLASNQVLYVQTWDGSGWTSNWNANLGDSKTRRFDIAYEEQSGDVIVVFGDGTTQLKYRERSGGTWDAQSQLAGSPLADTPFYVRAAARPTNDDVIIGIVTNAQTLHAVRWNGATDVWSDQVQMSANVPVASKDQEAFDLTFERSSGDAWVIWGTEAPTLRYREFTTSWQAEAVAYTLPDKPLWVLADYDRRPGTANIAVAVTLANNNFEFGAWNGGQWVGRPSPVAARDKVQRGIDVAFEATSGRAMFAFNTASSGFQLSTRTWTSGGGFSAVGVVPGSSGNLAIVQLRPDPRSDDIMTLYSDENKALYGRIWDGSSWSALGTPLETALSIHKDKEAFTFAWTRVVEYDVYFEIWNTATNAVALVVGSCVDQKLYGDDVRCSVSGVPAMDLASDEVVRIRVAHSSPGGSFALQYRAAPSVTPGDSRVVIAIPELTDMLFVIAVPLVILAVRLRAQRRRKGSG